MRKQVFSGIQPSGNLHLGNYLGAILHWVESQDEKDNIFCIVDYHAITVSQDPQILRQKIRELATLYLACGLDPAKSHLFVQSENSDHADLAWILNCLTPIGWMNRMTQYKDKSAKQKDFISVGLFDYPVLMASDILLYDTNEVPVGDDQKQHVEITRDIAEKFNHRFGDVFVIPEPVICGVGSRIMSLQDPDSKMSKSDPNHDATIFLLDPPEEIERKIKKAVTDSGNEILHIESKPAISNLLEMFSLVSGKSIEFLESDYSGKNYGQFKKDLAEAVISKLKPIQKKFFEINRQSDFVNTVLNQGLTAVQKISHKKLAEVKSVVGLGL